MRRSETRALDPSCQQDYFIPWISRSMPCGAAAARGGRRDGGGRFKAAGADMEEKLQRIALWLKKIYKNQPIPAFEANKRTVDILYDLAERNEARDRDVSLLIEDMMQKATEYEAEAKYLQGLLGESLALSPSSLSSKGTSYLDVLVNSAMILETKDTSLVSFFCAINDMTSELYATELKNRQMELELKDRMKKLTGALMLEKQIREDLEKTEKYLELEMSKAEYQSQKIKFLTDKSKDFKVRIKAAEDQLTATGLHKSLTHESLMSLSEELAQLQQETAPVKKKLQSYLDLPPSLSLAKVKIEELKQELNTMEAQFSKHIDSLTLEMLETRKFQFT
ncbi:HAUS augmin-like complex subunit 1 isoform X2 [Chroicocephalus ridibundus]|uniref:HAUS augmin-like complex subunit 1 isoform X2 n=1 Tax=Chroicocephalus ridibundus TaxID=1192867 RepID=UPI002FDE69FF